MRNTCCHSNLLEHCAWAVLQDYSALWKKLSSHSEHVRFQKTWIIFMVGLNKKQKWQNGTNKVEMPLQLILDTDKEAIQTSVEEAPRKWHDVSEAAAAPNKKWDLDTETSDISLQAQTQGFFGWGIDPKARSSIFRGGGVSIFSRVSWHYQIIDNRGAWECLYTPHLFCQNGQHCMIVKKILGSGASNLAPMPPEFTTVPK